MGNIFKIISNYFKSQPGLVEEPDRIWYPYSDEENLTSTCYDRASEDYHRYVRKMRQEKDRPDLRRKYTIR